MEQPKYNWEIQCKGEIWQQNFRSDTTRMKSYDFKFGYGSIRFRGTEDDLNDFIHDLQEEASHMLKIIGIYNLDETMIEISPALDEDGIPNGNMLITDYYDSSKAFYASIHETIALLTPMDRMKFYENTTASCKRFWVAKEKVNALKQKQHEFKN